MIYVGKAKNLRSRLTSYFQPLQQLHPRIQTMVLTARSLEWTVVATELEALTLEYTWIKEFEPRFNVVFRDDKTYPYLACSYGEEIPRVWITRSRKGNNVRFFGPYAKVGPLRQSFDRLLTHFPVRTCSSNAFRKAQLTGRPCLLASIGKCSAPCVGRIEAQEHRELCERFVSILVGRSNQSYIATLTEQMKQASAELEFEKAARIRDDIASLSTVAEHNAVALNHETEADFLGFATDELQASIHSFVVRAGYIRGEKNWNIDRVERISDSQLLADFIMQTYSDGLSDELDDDVDESEDIEIAERVEDAECSGNNDHTHGAEDAYHALNAEHAFMIDAVSTDMSTESSRSTPIHVTQSRDALVVDKQINATTGYSLAQITRGRHKHEQITGRWDVLAPITRIPREIIVPIEPDQCSFLENLLTTLRGSKVSIRVAARGEKRSLLDRANRNAQEALERNKQSRVTNIAARTDAMNELAKALHMTYKPLRIECFDIANDASGGYQVASMVVFEDGLASRSQYRKFSLSAKGSQPLDDASAIYATIARRFQHAANEERNDEINGDPSAEPNGKIRNDATQGLIDGTKESPYRNTSEHDGSHDAMSQTIDHASSDKTVDSDAHGIPTSSKRPRFAYKPQLLVVDGGQQQVNAAYQALRDCAVSDVTVCGIAKRLEEIWLPHEDYPVILKRRSEALYMLQRIRDESHRVAISYHRTSRRKGAIRSQLDDIPGLGKTYQQRLLRQLGSVKAIREASLEELMSVQGIGMKKAHSIYDHFHHDQ